MIQTLLKLIMIYTDEELWGKSSKFQPIRDNNLNVIEGDKDYVMRMKSTILPSVPEEILIEWFHRHADCLEKYAFLEFETLMFSKETWFLEEIPSREAFDDETFCDSFSNVEKRAEYKYDWLAKYMLETGTWNTPIVLLENKDGNFKFPYGEPLKIPYHLLEGHRRLSFLVGLKRIGIALPSHEVWIARKHF